MKRLLYLFLILFALPCHGQTLKDGVAAQKNGSYTAALEIYEILAAQGNMKAQHNAGVMYLQGIGIKKNIASATKMFEAAAQQGFVLSQCNLGVCFIRQGSTPELVAKALIWFIIAAKSGDQTAANNVDLLETHLTQKQIKQVRAIANAWKAGDPLPHKQPLPGLTDTK